MERRLAEDCAAAAAAAAAEERDDLRSLPLGDRVPWVAVEAAREVLRDGRWIGK